MIEGKERKLDEGRLKRWKRAKNKQKKRAERRRKKTERKKESSKRQKKVMRSHGQSSNAMVNGEEDKESIWEKEKDAQSKRKWKWAKNKDFIMSKRPFQES